MLSSFGCHNEEFECDIIYQDYYWNSISKEEVNSLMNGLPDGYFLIRNSSDGKPKKYTLTVRMNNENKLIYLKYENGKYGLHGNGPRFTTIENLIEYYKRNGMKEFNKNNTIILRSPLSKTSYEISGHPCNLRSPLQDSDLVKYYKSTIQDYVNLEKHIEFIAKNLDISINKLDLFTKLLKGLRVIHTWSSSYSLHIMNSFSSSIFTDSKHQTRTLTELNTKLTNSEDFINFTNLKCEKLKKRTTEMQECIKKHQFQLKLLYRRHLVFVNELKNRGVPETIFDYDVVNLETYLKEIQDFLSNNDQFKSENWFFPNADRIKSGDMLRYSPTGTFLVRRSSESDMYVLVVKVESSVTHCRLFGQKTFENIQTFIKTYRRCSLESFDVRLQTALIHPVKCVPKEFYLNNHI